MENAGLYSDMLNKLDQLTGQLKELSESNTIILSMRGVPSIDGISVGELDKLISEFQENGQKILMCGIQKPVMEMLERGGFTDSFGKENFHWDAVAAIRFIENEPEKVTA